MILAKIICSILVVFILAACVMDKFDTLAVTNMLLAIIAMIVMAKAE